jgi:RimJ/RimL family protein N-acetyltransferase
MPRFIAAPDLDTPRLTLRGHRLEDFDDSLGMWSDPVVTRHLGGPTFTREECWRRMLRYPSLWTWLGFGYWVVRERASGRFVGEVGFADFKRDLDPSIEGLPESGWVLATWSHGRGFASEALAAIHAWSGEHLPGDRTVCMIDTDNRASIRVAEKLGYAETARPTYKGTPIILFERKHGRTAA